MIENLILEGSLTAEEKRSLSSEHDDHLHEEESHWWRITCLPPGRTVLYIYFACPE